jgi:eukaryotic-like serine/threonine-protein kinase
MCPVPEPDYISPESVPGAIIDGKYRVESVIGRGGVGLVVAATHVELSQRVAIKMIRDDVPMQRELLDRFLREARAAVMIRSEHIAHVLDVGRLPTGRPYIVMEYLDGQDLEQMVLRGPLPVQDAVDYLLQACAALAEAHRSGIIHRDLKPANLFLTRRSDGSPLIKILDFGISKIAPLTATRGRGMETTSIMGSPGYMAPEQMKSTKDVDARADVWALGAVLYELVTGKPAFGGATMIEILNAIAACDPMPASQRQPGVPPELDVVIGYCLRTDPDQRYVSVADLAIALRPMASVRGAGLAERAWQIAQEPPPELPEIPVAMLPLEPRPAVLTVISKAKRRSSIASVLAYALGGAALAVAVAKLYSLTASARGVAPEPPALASVSPQPSSVPDSADASAAPAAAESGWVVATPALTANPPAPSTSAHSAATPGRRPPASPIPVRRHPTPAPPPSPDLGGFGDRK